MVHYALENTILQNSLALAHYYCVTSYGALGIAI